MFFLVGMLSHRMSDTIVAWMPDGRIVVALVAVLISMVGWVLPQQGMFGCIAIAMLGFLTLPPMFAATKTSAIDRALGEFSYPIYLCHMVVYAVRYPIIDASSWLALPALSFLFSIPLVLFVEAPLERWRQWRIERAHS
jgi:peptidoglycan/LPS O-acetylase OafA/YrhL